MARRRKHTLHPSILRLFEALEVKAWITPDGWIGHNGDDGLRAAIGEAIERVRPTGVRKTALMFGAVLLVAMDRGTFTPADIAKLDALGSGNADYILGRLNEMENDDA